MGDTLVGKAGLLGAGRGGHEKPFFASQTLAFPWLVMGGFFFSREINKRLLLWMCVL